VVGRSELPAQLTLIMKFQQLEAEDIFTEPSRAIHTRITRARTLIYAWIVAVFM
jgi:hypothetical protein